MDQRPPCAGGGGQCQRSFCNSVTVRQRLQQRRIGCLERLEVLHRYRRRRDHLHRCAEAGLRPASTAGAEHATTKSKTLKAADMETPLSKNGAETTCFQLLDQVRNARQSPTRLSSVIDRKSSFPKKRSKKLLCLVGFFPVQTPRETMWQAAKAMTFQDRPGFLRSVRKEEATRHRPCRFLSRCSVQHFYCASVRQQPHHSFA